MKQVKQTPPPKLTTAQLEKQVRAAANGLSLIYTDHACDRMAERGVNSMEVIEILKTGSHAPKDDTFKDGTWRYSIQGKTLDSRELEVVVGFAKNGTVVVTVIDPKN